MKSVNNSFPSGHRFSYCLIRNSVPGDPTCVISPSFIDDVENHDLWTWFSTSSINYQAHVSEVYRFGNKTLKNCLDILKTFLMYLKNDLELLKAVPHFPVIEIPAPRTTWLTPEAQKAVFGHVPDDDKPIIAFLMLSGCRPSPERKL